MLKFCVLFSGVTGSSKTPIANYLSIQFNLPILNNDAIRTEVREDLLVFDETEYIKRRNERIEVALKRNKSFIYDASIDRNWIEKNQEFNKHGYKHFIISLDLSKEFLKNIYRAKGSTETEEFLNTKLVEHRNFLKHFSDIVNIHISDDTFLQRFNITSKVLKEWVENQNSNTKS